VQRLALYETDALAGALDTDGCALIANAVPQRLCEDARTKIDALAPRHWDAVHDTPESPALDRFLCVFNRDPFWLAFLDRPGVIDLAERVLGPDCHVIGETAWRSHPGFRGEALHVDHLPLTWPQGALPDTVRVPAFILTAHFYLNEVTGDLAPTRIVPGSHRAGRAPCENERGWNGREPETVLAAAGDCLVFRSDLWHAGSDNVSAGRIRYLLQVHYGVRAAARHFSPFMAWRFDPDGLAAASKRQRRLLGDHEPGAYD
jgi:hypothetical protein